MLSETDYTDKCMTDTLERMSGTPPGYIPELEHICSEMRSYIFRSFWSQDGIRFLYVLETMEFDASRNIYHIDQILTSVNFQDNSVHVV